MADSDVHPSFNESDADVIIQSSDGVLFHIHRKNLEVCTAVFPGTDIETEGEVVKLMEPANVLQILFRFVYPKRHPNLKDQDFETVAAIAEAAGKYEVFPAINTCIDRLMRFLPDHSSELLLLGIKHDYVELINEAAQHIPLTQVVSTAEKLPALWIVPWLKFMERSKDDTFGKAKAYITGLSRGKEDCRSRPRGDIVCTGCRHSICSWMDKLESESMLSALNSIALGRQILTQDNCDRCKEGCFHLRHLVKTFKEGFNAIPQLTEFLGGKERF